MPCCCEAAAGLRARGRAFELGCDVLGGGRCRLGAVPGSSVRVEFWVGGIGERAVCLPAFFGCRRAVHGGADERVEKGTTLANFEQPGLLGGVDSVDAEAELGRGT